MLTLQTAGRPIDVALRGVGVNLSLPIPVVTPTILAFGDRNEIVAPIAALRLRLEGMPGTAGFAERWVKSIVLGSLI